MARLNKFIITNLLFFNVAYCQIIDVQLAEVNPVKQPLMIVGNTKTQISLVNGKKNYSYLCMLEKPKNIVKFLEVTEFQFDFWDYEEHPRFVSFKFTSKANSMNFYINNQTGELLSFDILCSCSTESERERDLKKYYITDDLLAEYYDASSITEIIAYFVGWQHFDEKNKRRNITTSNSSYSSNHQDVTYCSITNYHERRAKKDMMKKLTMMTLVATTVFAD